MLILKVRFTPLSVQMWRKDISIQKTEDSLYQGYNARKVISEVYASFVL